MNAWKPHEGPQTEALQRTEFEVLYGGARGGGKTDAGIVWLTEYITHPRFRGLVLRKNADDLKDWIDRALFMYQRYGAHKKGNPPEIHFPSGAVIRTGHLKSDDSFTKYQGHEYHRILLEELTQIPSEELYEKLLGSCRSTEEGLVPQIFATTNPGNIGHLWVKERFIDPAPWGTPFVNKATNRPAVFIPAKVEDNPTLMQKDPAYVQYLEALKVKNPELWKAWRLGDWDVFAGQFFKEFRRDRHVIRPFTPKKQLTRVAGVDWGYNASFVFLASAIEKVKLFNGVTFNRVWTYKEIAGTEQSPKEWAKQIQGLTDLDAYSDVYCDPAMFHRATDGSESIADQFKDIWRKNGYKMKPASNDRIAGWSRMHDWLSIAPDGLPYWIIGENCTGLIRTLPSMVHDEKRVEDIDTDGEDHWVDAIRYALVQLKWIDAEVGTVKSGVGTVSPIKAKQFRDGIDLTKFR